MWCRELAWLEKKLHFELYSWWMRASTRSGNFSCHPCAISVCCVWKQLWLAHAVLEPWSSQSQPPKITGMSSWFLALYPRLYKKGKCCGWRGSEGGAWKQHKGALFHPSCSMSSSQRKPSCDGPYDTDLIIQLLQFCFVSLSSTQGKAISNC
jgi:hypothetical protein